MQSTAQLRTGRPSQGGMWQSDALCSLPVATTCSCCARKLLYAREYTPLPVVRRDTSALHTAGQGTIHIYASWTATPSQSSLYKRDMATTDHLSQLNAIHWTPDRYARFIELVQRSEPLNTAVSSHKQRAFVTREQHHFSVTINELLFDSKPIIRQDRVQEVLQQYYDDVSKSRNGRDSFYARISAEVFGISRRAVQRFLQTQESYQTHLPLVAKHRVVQPIIVRRPFARWQVDLIDMTEYEYWNVGYAYALTCIDCFSKRAYIRQLKDKSGASVATAMRMIFLASKTIPSVVSSDHGTEFTSGEFQAILREHGVEHVLSSAYYPQSHGQIERFNRTFKRMLFAYMDRNDTNFWIRALPALLRNYNSSIHGVTKYAPNELHRDDLDEHIRSVVHRRLQRAAERSIRLSAKKGRRQAPIEIEVGDTVRISALTKASARKDAMLGSYKGYTQQWSTRLYTVASKSMGSEWYTLDDDEGEHIRKRYYHYQLQKIDPTTLVRSAQQPLPQVPSSSSSPPPFNREAHVASLPERRRTKEPHELPTSSALEERRQGSVAREIQPRRRLIEEEESK